MRLTQCSIINALAYRADTRPPEEIFSSGLQNRQTPEFQFLKMLTGGTEDVVFEFEDLIAAVQIDHLNSAQRAKIDDLNIPKAGEAFAPNKTSYRVWVKDDPAAYVVITLHSTDGLTDALWSNYLKNRPLYRKGMNDISPKTAVCFTLRPHVAPYFPIVGCQETEGEWVWIYAVVLGAAYKTYTYQEKAMSPLAAAKEVAVEHVSSNHVLCAVRCWRKGEYPTMDFVISPRICWNPLAGGERMMAKNEILAAFYPYQSMKTTVKKCVAGTPVRDATRLFTEPPYHYWRWQK